MAETAGQCGGFVWGSAQVDGANRTCDDLHVWLAPYTAGRHHYVFIDLGRPSLLHLSRYR
eukprot:958170-Rhodomonas_salina.4